MHRTGKWLNPSTPKKGWKCKAVFDSGSVDRWRLCEMCEARRIRYGHVVRHPDHPELVVGSECVKDMTRNAEKVIARDRLMRSRARGRERWLNHAWTQSFKGNYYTKYKGITWIVFRKGAAWSFLYEAGDVTRFSQRLFKTEEDAMLHAYDCITDWLMREHYD